MNFKELNRLVKDKEVLKRRINFFMKRGQIRKQSIDREEILGHIEKARNNLSFVRDNLDLNYFDWCVTGCYYTVYHATLSLILSKGYLSKNHNATLLVAIKEFYKKGIDKKDLDMLNKFYLTFQDLLFYVRSKQRREKASYSTKLNFNKKKVEDMRQEAIDYVNKIEGILARNKRGKEEKEEGKKG